MPQVAGGPKGLNALLHDVYSNCLKTGKGKAVCSASAWSAVRGAGWSKGKDGKWHKKSLDEIIDILKEREAAVTQSILLSKKHFKMKKEAIDWLKKHKKKFGNIEETDEYWRARQRDPDDFKPKSFRTHEIAPGIKLIIGRLK